MVSGENDNVLFRKTSMITLVAVYLLILVGGIVRSTGAGMGCPDWPKCFGMWIPPTSEEQLADTYKKDFVEYRIAKNQRFAGYLDVLGFRSKAEQVRDDQSILQETEFNVSKTWTEYINRLIGAVIGLLIIINFIASLKYYRRDSSIFVLSLFLVFLVIFQGWIGSIVVSTNLLPWMVTVHMLLAILIVAILIYLVFKARPGSFRFVKSPKKHILNTLLIVSGLMVLIQIVLGTQVRESIDAIAASLNYAARDTWIEKAGVSFLVHRSLSIILLLFHMVILYILFKNKLMRTRFTNYAGIIFGLMVFEAALGAIMAYFSIPPFAQPIHLLFAVGIFGLQFIMILILNNNESLVTYKTQIGK
jgi:cytochrome c oxidase assembly protein subunit 15